MISIDRTASLLVLSLLLLSFSFINVVYSMVGYSLVLSGTYSADLAVALEGGSAGTSQISVNGTIANVTVVSNSEDYVDSSISDVDSSPSKGTHSNFQAEQAGPDSNLDTLTEQNTETILFQQVTVDSQQTTSNKAWTDVPGATVSFTPSSSSEKWLVLVTAEIRSSSTSEDRARFRYVISGVARGETGVQQGTTNTNPIAPYNVYFHFSMVTGVSSRQSVKFQFQANPGQTAYVRRINILCIRLDSADLRYTEVNGDTEITGPQTLTTLQFTPPSAGDYIVAYCALVSELPEPPGGAETWLDFDSGTSLYPVAWAVPNTRRIESDRAQFEPHGLFSKISLSTAQHTFMVQAQLRVARGPATARDVRIAAFRIDAFELLEFDEDIAVASTIGDNTVRSVVTTQNPDEQRDYLILAGIHTISSGTSSREAGGIEIDDIFVQRKGDQRLSYAEIARIASHYACVKTSSTGFKVETTYGRGGAGADTIHSKQSVIYVLKIPRNYEMDLEVQWTNTNYNQTNEQLCIYADRGTNTNSLDTTGGYMIVGDGTPNWGSVAGTISFWVKWDVVANRSWGQHDNMETRVSGSRLVIDWGTSDSIISATSFTADKWYFIAVVWNEDTDELRLYVGDEANLPSLDTFRSGWTDTVSDEGVTQNNFMASKNGYEPIDGHGDDLRYWNIDRTLTQIRSDYDKELTGSEANLRSYFKLNGNFDDIGPNNDDGSDSGSYSFSTDVPSENIGVDVWTGSGWQNLFTDLANGWNNVSVSSYLTSSTFTIRYKGSSESGDKIQDSFKIDASLLHIWSDGSSYDYILAVASEKSYDQNIRLFLYSSSNIGRLSNCTVWLRDTTTSVQIKIIDGTIVSSIGDWYSLPASSKRYIVVYAKASSSGTSTLFIRLEAVKGGSIIYTCLVKLIVN